MNNNLLTLICLLPILLISFSFCTSQISTNYFYVASWNVENLFDTIDDEDKNDKDFLPDSPRNWNQEKLDLKFENLSKVIKYMNDSRGPDILGFQEVEHKSLIEELIDRHFSDRNYGIVYFESPDERGIDNGLIYDQDLFKLVTSEPVEVNLDKNDATRLILYTAFELLNDTLHVYVNHWPSRRGGLKKSEPNRIAAAKTIREHVEKILEKNANAKIIIMGDFNDNPKNISITKFLNAIKFQCNESLENDFSLLNLSSSLFQKGKGSYKYGDDWNMIDQIIISKSLAEGLNISYVCDSFEIIKPSFIVTKEGKYKGTSIPTYGGRKYLAGYSDHFPVGAKFKLKGKVSNGE